MSKSTRGQISLRRIFSIFGAVVMPLAQLGFAEGTQRLVKDINPTLRSAAGFFPSELVTSADGPDVIKTWSTDGSGTSLLKDTSASLPRNSKRLATVGSQASTLAIHVTGMGTVASNPPGTNCSADCVEDYSPGTVVTLSATPASGWTFAGWSGACRGSDECVIDMTVDFKSVMATFRPFEGVPPR